MNDKEKLLRVRIVLAFFALALFLSGVTAIPLQWELSILENIFGPSTVIGETVPSLSAWISTVSTALDELYGSYPFLAYGYDWLAFGHFVIAISFIGAIRDPKKNRWIIEYAMIACILLVHYAFVMGGIRGIPIGWRIIDSLFGIFGFIPLFYALQLVKSMAAHAVPEK